MAVRVIGLCGLLCSTSSGVLQVTDFAKQKLQVANATLATTVQRCGSEHLRKQVYLSTIAKNSTILSAQQQADISTIAHQCVYLGGRAVYEARAIYSLYSDEIYDDIALCNAVGIQARTIKLRDKGESTQNADIRIYPNPSAGNLSIVLPDTQVGSTVIITDLLGRVLVSEKLANTTNSLKLEVAEGVYQIQITQQEGTILYINKIVIVKP